MLPLYSVGIVPTYGMSSGAETADVRLTSGAGDFSTDAVAVVEWATWRSSRSSRSSSSARSSSSVRPKGMSRSSSSSKSARPSTSTLVCPIPVDADAPSELVSVAPCKGGESQIQMPMNLDASGYGIDAVLTIIARTARTHSKARSEL